MSATYRMDNTQMGVVATITQYSPVKEYLNLDRQSTERHDIKMNEDGLPLMNISRKGVYQFYPVSIANYLLEQVTKWYVFEREHHRVNFLRGSEAMLKAQDERGGWASNFSYTYTVRETGDMLPGWYSALGQGFMMSSMVRAFHLTDDKRFLNSAVRGAELFEIDVAEGGIRREGPFGGDCFYEEYPTPQPSHILNGFMFSLLGLYDTWQAANDSRCEQLFDAGMRTLIRYLSAYDLKDVSSYDLTHLTCPGNAANFSYGYHLTHIRLISALNLIAPDPLLVRVYDRWMGYAQGNRSKLRLNPSTFSLSPSKSLIDPVTAEIGFTVSTTDILLKGDGLQFAFSVIRDGETVQRAVPQASPDFTFDFKTPGNYIVRCAVIDRFDNRLSLQKAFHVRSASDEPKVRTKAAAQGRQISAEISTPDKTAQFAFYLLRGNDVIHKQMYTTNPKLLYAPEEPGIYSVRCYAKREGEPPHAVLEHVGQVE